jgi:hypothetical protein
LRPTEVIQVRVDEELKRTMVYEDERVNSGNIWTIIFTELGD